MEKDFDKLIEYTQNKLDATAKSQLEEQFQQDEDLAEEADFLKDLAKVSTWKALIKESEQELEAEQLKSTPTKTETIETPVRRIGWRSLLAYAASTLLVVMAVGLWNANTSYTNQALATKYVNKELSGVDLSAYRSDGNTQDAFQEGINALNAKKFQQASSFFESIPSEAEDYTQARLFLAISQFQEQAFSKAVDNAQLAVQGSQSAVTRHQAEWIRAQAFLADGQEKEAAVLIAKIAEDKSHIFQKEAVTLRKALGSMWRKMLF